MKTDMIPLEEVRIKGFAALVAALGVVVAFRFVHQYELGEGDYTDERKRLYDSVPARELYERMKKQRP